jgi:hypothetical protein
LRQWREELLRSWPVLLREEGLRPEVLREEVRTDSVSVLPEEVLQRLHQVLR